MYNRLKSYMKITNSYIKLSMVLERNFPLSMLVNTIQTNMDKKRFTCGVFIDFKKAFDTVNHIILLDKLHHYGIRGIVHEWFSSYLANRTQTTHIDNDHISSKKSSPTGVPQGSVLGPLLFFIYIHDIIFAAINLDFIHLLTTQTCFMLIKT